MRFSARHPVTATGRSGPARFCRLLGPTRLAIILFATSMGVWVGVGCTETKKKAEPPPPRYSTLPPRENLPNFMKGTIYEIANIENNEPYPISGYGLVADLMNTGNNAGTPTTVRSYVLDLMLQHKLGPGSSDDRFRAIVPESVLQQPQFAIVEVFGFLPPGARAGQRVDVLVRATEKSLTKSLVHGMLWQTDLFEGGVNPLSPNPKGRVNVYMKARGRVFVNPGYMSQGPATQPAGRVNLRSGEIMDGGLVINDRPLWIRVRDPQRRTVRAIEARINQRFENDSTARAQDEGRIWAFVPRQFNGDWEHFVGVVTHLYLSGQTPGTGAIKAKELAEEAVKDKALLQEISYCWEGIGTEALPFIQPLYVHKAQDVSFAAARAGALIGDAAAEEALLDICKSDNHQFQLNAVKIMGELTASPRIDRMLTQLLSTRNALVRIEAYRILAAHQAPVVSSVVFPPMESGREPEFIIDRVWCQGPPLIWAARSGVPRIAVFGPGVSLNRPIMFSAMNNGFTISTAPDGRSVLVVDRISKGGSDLVKIQAGLDVCDLLKRLAGEKNEGFRFGYSDLVGILQSLERGRHLGGAFVLQDLPMMQDLIEEAPPIIEPSVVPPAPPGGTADTIRPNAASESGSRQ